MSDTPSFTRAAVVIRPMQSEDLPAVQAIDQLSFTMPWPSSAYHYELFENTNSLLWVAEIQDTEELRQVVGMVVVWLILDEAHIATIAVHPDFRSQGIAARLLATALEGSIDRGMRTATLEVRANNPPAQRLYAHFGFEQVGRRPRYYRDNNEDALILTVSALDRNYADWLAGGGWKNGRTPPKISAEREPGEKQL